MIEKNHLDAMYTVSTFEKHYEVKDQLLKMFETCESQRELSKNLSLDIYRSDWFNNEDLEREWVKFFLSSFDKEFSDICKELGYTEYKYMQVWFQQYLTNGIHDWHTHSGHFAHVYYLELPEDGPKTVLVNPYTQAEYIIPDVREGQIITFPSWVIHRSPRNESEKRKTVVSMNFEVRYSPFGSDLVLEP